MVQYHTCLILDNAAAVQTVQFKLVSGHVSELLSLSLSMTPSGTTAELSMVLCRKLAEKVCDGLCATRTAA